MAIPLPPLAGLGDVTQAVVGQNPADAYGTPASIAAQREYAKALMTGTQGKGGAQFPVVQSWTQGVSNMVNALMGGLETRDANQRDQNSIAKSNQLPATPSPNDGPSSEGHEKQADAGEMSREAEAIASIESKGSGDYSAVGPVTHTGDRAYGRYQVMGANIPSWTREVLGREMSPQEFLANKGAQDAVFRTKFGQSADNDTDRASIWFTGRPLAQGGRSSDGYITGNQYVDRFNKAMGTPSQAMAFAGPDGGDVNPAVAATVAALKNDPQVAQNGVQLAGARGAAPAAPKVMPNGTGIYYDPRLIKPPPQYTPEQMQAIMNNPVLTPEAKAGIFQQYRTQGQPIELPYPGGHVIVDPRNPSRQQFIPDLQKGTSKLGDMEVPNYQTIGPSGATPNIQVNPIQSPPPPPGPQSNAAPAVAPGAPPAAPVGPMPVTAQTAPVAPTPPPTALSPSPVQVASNDPAAGVTKAAAQEELTPVQKQMLAMAGPDQPVTGLGPALAKPEAAPEATPVAAETPKATIPPNTALGKLAANDDAIKRFVGPELFEAYKQKKNFEQGQAVQQKQREADIDVAADAAKEGNKLNSKRYEDLQNNANAAADQRNNIATARALTNDPNFYAGLANGVVENWKRFKSAMGIDPGAAAPMEVFKKTTAQSIMSGLKTAFGGLGQIRVAEIRLQELANASTSNTPTAIKALLEITDRNAAKVQQIADMASAYKSGDAVTDPKDPSKVLIPANKPGPDGSPMERTGLDSHWDKMLHQWYKANPTFTDEEYNNFAETLKGKKGEAEIPTSEPKVGDTKEFDNPTGGKITGVWDGKAWGPKK